MKAIPTHFMGRPLAVTVTLALTAGLAGFSLTHSVHRGIAAKNVALPDRPDGGGTGTRLPNGWHITPAGTPISLPGDLPLKMAFSPDGKSLLVLTGGYHDHGVSVIDPQTNTVAQSVNLGKVWAGMCFDAEGDDLYVSGGGPPTAEFLANAAQQGADAAQTESFHHPILRLKFAGGALTPAAPIDIPGLSDAVTKVLDEDGTFERFTAGLASGPDGALYAVNTQNDTVYKLAGAPRALAASAKVGYRPYAAALSPDGRTLAVSDMGDGSVSLLDSANLQERTRVKVGSQPNELAWGRDGRLFVANAGSNSVSIIQNGAVTETVKTSLDPRDPVGSTPDALALSPDGKRLYVANGDNNDVAVIDTSVPRASRVLGFIPTGWYPSALAVAPNGRTLYIGTGKGLSFAANDKATNPYTRTQPVSGQKYDYIGGLLSGAVCAVRLPDASGLARYTRQVYANTPGSTPTLHSDDLEYQQGLRALGKIKHVLYVIRENRTYDQVLGDMTQGNGDPNLTIFGAQVTPNAHALAAHYVLLDNLYCNGEVSEDGHKWCDAAYATDFIERAWPSSYSSRGEPDGDARVADSPAGEIWDNCARHGLTYFSYGEAADFKSTPNAPPVFTGDKSLAGHASPEYGSLGWFKPPRDLGRAAIFLRDLDAAEKTGQWPRLTVMWLPEDHTQGLAAGAFTPVANVAENDQALGRIVEGISRSRFWKDTAIFVIEDDAQNGPDHVDAHRTEGLILSPYVKRGAVDSTQYTTASMVHTMEMILHLPPMTQFDRNATPMLACFTTAPDLTAYASIGPKVDLEAKNPSKGAGATASAKLDLSGPDRADPDALNAILWHALKPGQPIPAPVRSARRE